MNTVVGPRTLLVSQTGLLHPVEVKPESKVLGLGSTGKPSFSEVTASPIGESRGMTLFTTRGEVTLGTGSGVYQEGKEGKIGVLLERLQRDRYDGRNDAVAVSPFLPPDIAFLKSRTDWWKEIGEDAGTLLLLGCMVRRVPEFADRVVLAVRRELAEDVKREIEHQCGHILAGFPKGVRLVEGKSWSWLRVDSPRLLEWLGQSWPNPRDVPFPLRALSKKDLLRFLDGALLVTRWSREEPSHFTYLEESTVRQMIGIRQSILNEGLEVCPDPVYQPMDVTLRLGGPLASTAHVQAFHAETGPLFKLDIAEKLWAPIASSVILKPT